MIKVCIKCKQEKNSNLFGNRVGSRDGKDTYCKVCKRTMTDKWRKENFDEYKKSKQLSDKKWYENNKERKLRTNAKWKIKNIKYSQQWYRDYKKKRESKDPSFKIANKIRNRLWYAMKGKRKECSFDEYTGCSRQQLIAHLESKFQPGMTWDNYGKEWEIDHIEALSKFDLIEKKELLKACHYTNLQPLWKKEHKKKTRIDLSCNRS